MDLKALIHRFRTLADDQEEPPFWSNEDVARWLSDGQEQACIRGRLLLEDARDAVCRIVLEPGRQVYKLHRALYELLDVRIRPAVGGSSRPLSLVTREWLNAEVPHWRDCDQPARFAIQAETSLRVVGGIAPGDVLYLEGYRLPLVALKDDSDTPEIHEAHHVALVQWALFQAFSVPDADTFDPNRAKLAEETFTRYFGPLPDSDLRRATRQDVPHHTVAVMP